MMADQFQLIESKEFRNILGTLATGVTVIVAGQGDNIRGMTANSVTSLSLEPLLVLFCVAKTAKFAAHLRHHEGFTINVLRRSQLALSNYFSGDWPKDAAPPDYELIPWHGAPRLNGCAASVGCKTEEFLERGDHWIVIGQVLALHKNLEPIDPLVYFQGRYRSLRQDD